jgi:hypothetical protein
MKLLTALILQRSKHVVKIYCPTTKPLSTRVPRQTSTGDGAKEAGAFILTVIVLYNTELPTLTAPEKSGAATAGETTWTTDSERGVRGPRLYPILKGYQSTLTTLLHK